MKIKTTALAAFGAAALFAGAPAAFAQTTTDPATGTTVTTTEDDDDDGEEGRWGLLGLLGLAGLLGLKRRDRDDDHVNRTGNTNR